MSAQHMTPRLGHAARSVQHKKLARRQSAAASSTPIQSRAATCAGSGALYAAPLSGAVVDSAVKTQLTWNPDCLDDAEGKIDVYLYAPQEPTANLPIHAWTGIPAREGNYAVKLAPKWWNASASVELSLNIVPAGNQPWDTANPFGPMWTATYTAPTDGSAPPADAVEGSSESNSLISFFYKGDHLTPGGKAAAIICPLLVLFIGIGILVRKMHLNRNNKTADWAEQIDKRMSQISIDWMDGGDGSAGPRPGSRPASYLARPTSLYRPSLEAVRAYYNTNVAGSSHDSNGDGHLGDMSEVGHYANAAESMSHARTSNYRVSRVSFAPSTEAEMHNKRKSTASMARVGATNNAIRSSRNSNLLYRNSQANTSMPRIHSKLAREDSGAMDDAAEDGEEFVMSPLQEQGARCVDFDALMQQPVDSNLRDSVMEYPAAQMIRSDNSESQHGAQSTEVTEAYAHGFGADQAAEETFEEATEDVAPLPRSNSGGMRSLVNASSPDEAMLQYAMTRSASRAGATTPQQSAAPRRPNNGGNLLMRTLYRSNSQANTKAPSPSPPSEPSPRVVQRSNSDASSVHRKPVDRGSSVYEE